MGADADLGIALIATFSLVLLGDILCRLKFLGRPQLVGVAAFAGRVALPALLIHAVATLKLQNVQWRLVAGIMLAKGAVFIVAVVVSFLISSKKRGRRLQEAGLDGIFVVQSNDLALGLPLFTALYAKEHPEFITADYIVTVAGLVLLVPWGFAVIEWGKSLRNARTTKEPVRCGNIARTVVKGVVTNPIVLAVVVGLILQFSFKSELPNALDRILQPIGAAFAATALVVLGGTVVGRTRRIGRRGAVRPLVLILTKTLVLPIVCKFVLDALNAPRKSTLFGFLYGTLPTAPIVFVWAQQFGVESEQYASYVVLCTLVSAPLTFISAHLAEMLVSDAEAMKLESLLTSVTVAGGVAAILAGVYFVGIMVWFRWNAGRLSVSERLITTAAFSQIGQGIAAQFCSVPANEDARSVHDFAVDCLAIVTRTSLLILAVVRWGGLVCGYAKMHVWRRWIVVVPWLLGLSAGWLAVVFPPHKNGSISPDCMCGNAYLDGSDITTSVVLAAIGVATIVMFVLERRRASLPPPISPKRRANKGPGGSLGVPLLEPLKCQSGGDDDDEPDAGEGCRCTYHQADLAESGSANSAELAESRQQRGEEGEEEEEQGEGSDSDSEVSPLSDSSSGLSSCPSSDEEAAKEDIGPGGQEGDSSSSNKALAMSQRLAARERKQRQLDETEGNLQAAWRQGCPEAWLDLALRDLALRNRYALVLAFSCLSILVATASKLWGAVDGWTGSTSDKSGVGAEMAFLDICLNLCQAVFIAAVFGFAKPFSKNPLALWRRIRSMLPETGQMFDAEVPPTTVFPNRRLSRSTSRLRSGQSSILLAHHLRRRRRSCRSDELHEGGAFASRNSSRGGAGGGGEAATRPGRRFVSLHNPGAHAAQLRTGPPLAGVRGFGAEPSPILEDDDRSRSSSFSVNHLLPAQLPIPRGEAKARH